MSFFSNLFGFRSIQPPKKPNLTGFVSVKKLGECCIKGELSLPAIDIISILRIVWSRRFEGPFLDVLTNSLDVDNIRDIKVILIPSGGMTEKILPAFLEESFKELMDAELVEREGRIKGGYPNLGYDLPKFQLEKIMEFSYSDWNPDILPHLQPLGNHIGLFNDTPNSDVIEAFFAGKEWGEEYWCYESRVGDDLLEFYQLNMRCNSSKESRKAYISTVFRLLSDPCVQRICVDKHNSEDTKVQIFLTEGAPFSCFTQTLNFFTTEEEVKSMIVPKITFPEGEASLSMCRAYPEEINYDDYSVNDVFSIDGRRTNNDPNSFLWWGPNGTFVGFPKVQEDPKDPLFFSNPLWNDSIKSNSPLLSHLMVARKYGNEVKIDYGWVSSKSSKTRLILHPVFLENFLEKYPDSEITWGQVETAKSILAKDFSSIEKYVTMESATEEDYEEALCQFGFREDSLVLMYH